MIQDIPYDACKRAVLKAEPKAKLKTGGYLFFIADANGEPISRYFNRPEQAWIDASKFVAVR